MNVPRTIGLALLGLISSAAHAEEEVWTGDRVIDAPVAIRGKSLRIAPGARIAFKGEGRLLVQDGGLTASHVVFGARTTATNFFRISVQGGRVDLSDCRFQGLKAVEPQKGVHYIEGFMRSQGGGGSRIVHCTFADCSAVMILNAVRFEISRNLAIRCNNVFAFLNCTECRVEFNEFFNAPRGFTAGSGTRLSEFFRNRFTDCDIGLYSYYTSENRYFGNAFFGGKEGMKLWGLGPKSVIVGNRFEGVNYPFSKNGKPHESCVFRDNPIK